MPVSTITSVTTLAEALLILAETALAQTTEGTPGYSYMEAGPLPAWDCCPALIVYVPFLSEEGGTKPDFPTMTTGMKDRYGRVNMVHLRIVVLRCAAMAEKGIPDVAAKNAVAAQVQEDGWALWTAIYNAKDNGTFLEHCRALHFDNARALPEQGGCVGWEMTLRAQLDGVPGTGS